VESRTDLPGLLESGAWSNLSGARDDQDGETANATPSAETDECNGSCWDGGTEWLAARKFGFNTPPGAAIQAIAFAFSWSIDGGAAYGCPINIYNFGVLKNNGLIPYAYAWVYQNPYVPPPNDFSTAWWPFDDQIGVPGDSGIWSSNFWVPVTPNPGWTAGYALWGNNWIASDINAPGFGAGFSTEFWWSCAGDSTHIHVDNVQMAVYFTGSGPMISGPHDVWWFNGATPTNYPTQITLHSDAGTGTSWSVTSGAGLVSLLVGGIPCSTSCVGEDLQVTATQPYFSTAPDDISVTASVGGQTSSPFTLTSRVPNSMTDPSNLTLCDNGFGYETDITYLVRDTLGDPMTDGLDYNEKWTTGVNPVYGGTNWPQNPETPGSLPGQFLIDVITGPGVNNQPAPVPTPTCNSGNSVEVVNWGQEWRIGSQVTGSGVLVQSDTLHKYNDKGTHTQ